VKVRRAVERRGPVRSILGLAASTVVLGLLLTGCTADPLAKQYADGSAKNYTSGDGTVVFTQPSSRQAPVTFSGTSDSGAKISSSAYANKVLIVNFWYAGCPPCRKEAPILSAAYAKYSAKGVDFLGVNTMDQAATAQTFTDKFGLKYPSIVDANDTAVQFAFAGSIKPDAVPTTLVIDRSGRVAGRISGLIHDASELGTLIDAALAEKG
jgi:peroxiredoxin